MIASITPRWPWSAHPEERLGRSLGSKPICVIGEWVVATACCCRRDRLISLSINRVVFLFVCLPCRTAQSPTNYFSLLISPAPYCRLTVLQISAAGPLFGQIASGALSPRQSDSAACWHPSRGPPRLGRSPRRSGGTHSTLVTTVHQQKITPSRSELTYSEDHLRDPARL